MSATGIRRRRWTRQEELRLAAYWGERPAAWVARELGRTVAACAIRAKRKLRQNRRAAVVSARDVGRIFGINDSTVKRLWLSRGWVWATRSSIGSGGRGMVWDYSTRGLRRFVRERPWAYDPERMDPGHWLTDLAREVHAADPWLTIGQAAALLHYHPEIVRGWVRQGRLPHRRRPVYGTTGGDPGGRIVIRRSDALAFPARLEAETHANLSAAARARVRRTGLPNGAWPRASSAGMGDAAG